MMNLSIFIFICLISSSFQFTLKKGVEAKQLPSGLQISNINEVKLNELDAKLKCLKQFNYNFISLNLYSNGFSLPYHANDISNIITKNNYDIIYTISPNALVKAEDIYDNIKNIVPTLKNTLWLNITNVGYDDIIIRSFVEIAKQKKISLGIMHDLQGDFSSFGAPVWKLKQSSLPALAAEKCSISSGNLQINAQTDATETRSVITSHAATADIAYAFSINYYDQVDWNGFPQMLDCLKQNDFSAVFLTVYYENTFVPNIIHSIPQILSRGFKLYIRIAPNAFASKDAATKLLSGLKIILENYEASTSFVFYDADLEVQPDINASIQSLNYVKAAAQDMKMEVGISTNNRSWDYNYGGSNAYSDLPLWSISEIDDFKDFVPYGGWKAPVAFNNAFVGSCTNFKQFKSFLYMNYKPQMMEGLHVSYTGTTI